jgi:hypothetical protein
MNPNPNPNLELIYNGLVSKNLLDTSGGYSYKQFENWIAENSNNLRTVYDGMLKNNLLDDEGGSYTYDKFQNWIGNVDVSRQMDNQQHVDKSEKNIKDPYTGEIYGVDWDKIHSNKSWINKQLGLQEEESYNSNERSVLSNLAVMGWNFGNGIFFNTAQTFENLNAGTTAALKEENREQVAKNIGNLITGDKEMMEYLSKSSSERLANDESIMTSLLRSIFSGTPEEKEAKMRMFLNTEPGSKGLHTILKYVFDGAVIPLMDSLTKETDILSSYYDNEGGKEIAKALEAVKVHVNHDEEYKEKGLSALFDSTFWVGEFTDGAAFFGSAMATGGVTNLGMKATGVLASKVLSYPVGAAVKIIKPSSSLASVDKAFSALNKVSDSISLPLGVTAMSLGEASIEAQGVESSLRPEFEEKYRPLVESGEITQEQADELITSKIRQVQDETMRANMALLLFTNGIELGSMARSIRPKGSFRPEVKTIKGTVKDVLVQGAQESFEENFQAAIETYEKNKYLYEKRDDYGINLSEIFMTGVGNLDDPETIRAMLSGFLLGAGASGVKGYQDYKTSKKFYDEIQPQLLQEAQNLGLNAIRSLYSVDKEGNLIIDEIAKNNFFKSYLDYQNDSQFLEKAIKANDADLIEFAHNALISKFMYNAMESGITPENTLGALETILENKYKGEARSKVREIAADGSLIGFDEFKNFKMSVGERAAGAYSKMDEVAKSKGIDDLKHRRDIFDSLMKRDFIIHKIDQLGRKAAELEDSELQVDKDKVKEIRNKLKYLVASEMLYRTRIDTLTRPDVISRRNQESIIESIKIQTGSFENQFQANLEEAVKSGLITQKVVDEYNARNAPKEPTRSKDEIIVNEEQRKEEEEKERQKLDAIKRETSEKYGIDININSDNSVDELIPDDDSPEQKQRIENITKELEGKGVKIRKVEKPEETQEKEEEENPSGQPGDDHVGKFLPGQQIPIEFPEDGAEIPIDETINTTEKTFEEEKEEKEEKEPVKTSSEKKNRESSKSGEIYTASKERDIDEEINELQNEITEIDRKKRRITYDRINEAWNKLAYLVRSFRQFFLIDPDFGFTVTRNDYNNFIRDEVRSILNPNEYKPGKVLYAVIDDDSSIEMYVPGDKEKETTTWGAVKEKLISGTGKNIEMDLYLLESDKKKELKELSKQPLSEKKEKQAIKEIEERYASKVKELQEGQFITGADGIHYTYEDLVPISLVDENGDKQSASIHITSWISELNVEEEDLQSNRDQLRQLRNAILADPASRNNGVKLEITDRSNGVLMYIVEEGTSKIERTTLSELANDVDLIVSTKDGFVGTASTNVLINFSEISKPGVTYFIYQLNVDEDGNPIYGKSPVLNKKLADNIKNSIKLAVQVYLDIRENKPNPYYERFKAAGYDFKKIDDFKKYLRLFISLTQPTSEFNTFEAFVRSKDSDFFGFHVANNGHVEVGNKVKFKSSAFSRDQFLSVLDNTLNNMYFSVAADYLKDSKSIDIIIPLVDEEGNLSAESRNYADFVRENVDTKVAPIKVGTDSSGKSIYVATIQPIIRFKLSGQKVEESIMKEIEKESETQDQGKDKIDDLTSTPDDIIDSIFGNDDISFNLPC